MHGCQVTCHEVVAAVDDDATTLCLQLLAAASHTLHLVGASGRAQAAIPCDGVQALGLFSQDHDHVCGALHVRACTNNV